MSVLALLMILEVSKWLGVITHPRSDILYRTHPYEAPWNMKKSGIHGFSNLTPRGAGAETERSRAPRGGIGSSDDLGMGQNPGT